MPTTGEILGKHSKGEPLGSRSCRTCDKCHRQYKKNWMVPYWKKPPMGDASDFSKRRGYLCMYCNMDREGMSMVEGIKEIQAGMFLSVGGDITRIFDRTGTKKKPFSGEVPSGQVDIDTIPEEALKKIMQLQLENQELTRKLANKEH